MGPRDLARAHPATSPTVSHVRSRKAGIAMGKEPWHNLFSMGADEQVRGSVDEAAARADADQTAEVPTMSFDDAKKALGEDVKRPGLDEQPTKKMSALSATDAEKITGERRSVRVFKHPSKPPPPRLELPLATAQFQAIDEELLPDAPSSLASEPSRPRSRGAVITAVLFLAAAAGAALAWATHEAAPAGTTLSSPPNTTQRAAEPAREVSPEPPAAEAPEATEATEPPLQESTPPPQRRAEAPGPERAESLLEEAEGLRGAERLAALEAASTADPSNPHAAAALAEFHMENDPHEALEYALQAAQLRRRRASYQDLVADAYERIGNLNDAAHARATAVSLREGGD